ncbi:MAG TPA: LuxR C-terminal-related transcriptional regulator, partial [Acidimicrobiales bacterium]|nr:LuxR C-terminal-related transcriptional regulator [Acidimicrobiales bacterium]
NGKPVVDEISAVEDLTARQREVLDLFVEGQRVSMIADRLFLSRSTVRNHLATIFQKLGVHTQAELIALLRHPTA